MLMHNWQFLPCYSLEERNLYTFFSWHPLLQSWHKGFQALILLGKVQSCSSWAAFYTFLVYLWLSLPPISICNLPFPVYPLYLSCPITAVAPPTVFMTPHSGNKLWKEGRDLSCWPDTQDHQSRGHQMSFPSSLTLNAYHRLRLSPIYLQTLNLWSTDMNPFWSQRYIKKLWKKNHKYREICLFSHCFFKKSSLNPI